MWLRDKAAELYHRRKFQTFPIGENKRPCAAWGRLKKETNFCNSGWGHALGYGIVTGEISGLTVVDIDDMKWFKEFEKKHKLTPTTRVVTGSGGLHLYYKYNSALLTTTKLNDVDLDIRNDGAIVIGPGSTYNSDKTHKQKFNGLKYKFAEGSSWDNLCELDQV